MSGPLSRPIVGIIPDVRVEPEDARRGGVLSLNLNYTTLVAEAGGVPLMVPPAADMAAVAPMLDAWLIPGGNDMDAARFGQETHPACKLQDPARYDAEARLYALWDPNKPVLGICYGLQFLNVIRGGNLVQHIPDVIGHERHSSGELESVRVHGGTLLAERVSAGPIRARSFHHQAVGDLGAGLRVSALAEDGTVEAIEDPSLPFFVGVQWHPERTADDAATKRLMRAFLDAAG